MNNSNRPMNLLERLRRLLLLGADAPPAVHNPGSDRFLFNGNIQIELSGDYQLASNEQLKATGSLDLTVDGKLENQGTLQAQQRLRVLAHTIHNQAAGHMNASYTQLFASEKNNGKIDNHGLIEGETIEGCANTINPGHLSGNQIKLQVQQFNNHETLHANGNLSLTVRGELNNYGTLRSLQQLTIRANFIRNHANGVINATHTRVLASEGHEGKINNRGLIDGQTTEVRAHSLNNISTGRLYGDQVMIGATTLDNYQESSGGTAAVIAARNNLSIGAQQINNREHALLFSGNTMAIGGQLNPQQQLLGKALQFNNESAVIEMNGNAHFNIHTLNNRDLYFSTREVQVRHTPGERRVEPSPRIDRPNDYTAYDYSTTVTETQIAHRDPAKLLIGGNLMLEGHCFNNDKSQVTMGGTMTGSLKTIHRIDAKGERKIEERGTAQWTYTRWRGGLRQYTQRYWDSAVPYYKPITQPIQITVALEQRNTRPLSSGVKMTDRPEIALAQLEVISVAALNPREMDSTLTTQETETTASAPPIVVEPLSPPLDRQAHLAANPQPGDTPRAATSQALSPYDHWIRTVRKLGQLVINNNRKNIAFQQSKSAAWARGEIITTPCPDGSVAFELSPEALQLAKTAGEQAWEAWCTWRRKLDLRHQATEANFLQDRSMWMTAAQELSDVLSCQNTLTISRTAIQIEKSWRRIGKPWCWHRNSVVPIHYSDGSIAIELSLDSLESITAVAHRAISLWNHNRKTLQSVQHALESHSPSDTKPWIETVQMIACNLLDKKNDAEMRLDAARKYLAWRYSWGDAITTIDANNYFNIDLPDDAHAAATATGVQALQQRQSRKTKQEGREPASEIDPRSADHRSWIALVCQLNQELTHKTEDEVRTTAVQRSQAGAWEWGEAITTIDNHGQIVFDLPPSAKKAAMAAGQQAVQTWQAQQAEFNSAWQAAGSDEQFADYFAWLNILCQYSNTIWSRNHAELLLENPQKAPAQKLHSSATLLRSVPPLNDREAWLTLVQQLYRELSSQQESEIRTTAVQKQMVLAYEWGELIQGINAELGNRTDLKFNARIAAEMAGKQAVTEWQAQKSILLTAQCQLESNYPVDNSAPWVAVVQQLYQTFGSEGEAKIREVAIQKGRAKSYEQGQITFSNTGYGSLHPTLTALAEAEAEADGTQAVILWRTQQSRLKRSPFLLTTERPLEHHRPWIKVVTQLSQLAWQRSEAQLRAIARQSSQAAAWARGEWILNIQDRDNERPTATLSLLPSALGSAAEAAEQAAADWLALHQEEQPPSPSHLEYWLNTVRQLITLLEQTTPQALREALSQRSQAWAWEWGEVDLGIHEDGQVTIDLPAQAKEAATQAGERAVKTWQQQTAWLAMAYQALTAPTAALLGELPTLTIPQPAAAAPVDIIDRLTQQMIGETTSFTGVGVQPSVSEDSAYAYRFMTTPLAA